MEQLKEIIEDSKKIINQLKPCSVCIHSNKECDWCNLLKKPIISKKAYGCVNHKTNEEALEEIAKEQMAIHQEQLRRLLLTMDVMSYMINGASMVLEVVDKELEESYNSIRVKDDACVKNHVESKKNRDRLHKAYKKMKFSAQDMRNTFDTYIEYFFNTLFGEKDGSYNFKESDKSLVNSGTITAFVNLFVEKTLDNGDNASAIYDYMQGLKGCGILKDEFNRYLIKK